MAMPKKKTAVKLHVKKNDTVLVRSGKDAGKKGKVLVALPAEGKIIVEGVHVATMHKKPRGQGMPGGIIHKETAIFASKVMLLCPKCNKATRIGHAFLQDGKKVRVCKKCNAEIDS